ncbi:MAG TPA: enterotoxin [Gemmatimonadaceae bacterium]|nr:enterotoxin [Gemmatimonadaceae bacterium]
MPPSSRPFPPHDGATPLTRREFLEHGAALAASIGLAGACAPVHGPRPTPGGLARFTSAANDFTLANDALSITFAIAGGGPRIARLRDVRAASELVPNAPAFALVLADGTTLSSDALRVVSGPTPRVLAARTGASRLAERMSGRQVSMVLEDASGRVRAAWSAILRDGSSYIRQEVVLEAHGGPLPVREIVMLDLPLPAARVNGTVKGSPIVAGSWFTGFEHPLSASTVDGGRARAALTRELPLRPGAPFTASSVIGVARAGQLRRDFLAYVERERAHPYRTFLHYNSWYDIGYFSKYSEPEALAVIDAFGSELVRKRGVTLSSFLFDDGWDDPTTLWGFHSGFPNGFAPLREAAARYGAAPGVWMSPWGGYGKPKEERLANGRAQGFETNRGGFALSGPRYYARFRETCLTMIRRYGVNQFKIDGTGNVSSAFPGSAFDSDFDAAITLIGDLRAEKPDLYLNLTTGTFPSPFWLRYADSIWRGGEDHSFAGVGSNRQQWITYRDGDTFRGVVGRGPLFPLNSLMLHGLIYARHAKNLDTDPGGDFTSEIRAYFGTGTQLQEMYVTPSLLTAANWDSLAEAANWSRRNAGTLADTHWIGGDPRQLEVYGHAAWSPARGILSLRNPSDKPQSIAIDVARAFELPEGAARDYTAQSPWSDDRGRAPVALRGGTEHVFNLAPFEVLTLDANPV